jgi:ribosome-binding protein aMBF1 (putative translation factor)
MANIRDSNAQLSARIRMAMDKLEEVARLTSEDAKELQVDSLFFTLRDEVYSVLHQLDLNSDFADALNRAKEGTIVLKSWYERQPENYPNRDHSIEQLTQAIEEYGIVDERLNQSRALAQEKLSTIMRQHRVILQELNIGKVLEAIAAARSVVEGLNDITSAMTIVEEQTNASLKTSIPIAQ